jgi:lysophospholipase L1-like esterase
MAALMLTCSCQNKTKLDKVAEPAWYDYEDYFIEKNGIFSDLPIYPDDIVMLGDEIIDFGEWADFFQDTCMVNRGIMFEGSPHTLYRIDGIAKATPKKIFVSTGLQDIKRASDDQAKLVADTVIANVKEIFRRAHAISPETELYYLGILADRQVSDAGVVAVAKANKHIKDAAEAEQVFTFIDLSNLADGSGRMAEEYTFDGRSLNGFGYERVTEKVLLYLSGYKKMYNKAADHVYPEISPAHHNRVSLFNSLPKETNSVMFLGNSITRRGPWEELFPFMHTTNRGVGGDVLRGMYNRVDDVVGDKPVAIFLMGGINDITNPSKSVDEIWKDYERLVDKIRKELPTTALFVQSTLPVTAERDRDNTINPKVVELNKYLAAAAEKYGYNFVDLTSAMCDENGYLKPDYSIDGLHLSADGYFTWSTVLIEKCSLLVFADQQRLLNDYDILDAEN